MGRWIVGVFLWTNVLLGSCRGSWLRGGKSKSSSALDTSADDSTYAEDLQTDFQGSCTTTKQTTCWCGQGADRAQTVINVRQCPYYTTWGPQCEPCKPTKKLCQRLEQCARCNQYNPNAICADCPPDKHGLLCNKDRPCKMPNITEHMTVHPYFTKKGTYKLEFRCSGQRVRNGHRVIRCITNSRKWNKSPPKCVLPLLCSSLPTSPLNNTRVKEGSSSLERVVYECDDGYVTSGEVLEMVLHCENGVWVQVGPSVQCELKGCKNLTVEHGEMVYSGELNPNHSDHWLLYTTAQATCHKNFVLENPLNVTCSHTGQWLPSPPKCIPRQCEEKELGKMCSVAPVSAFVVPETNLTEIYPGQTVRYKCKDNYYPKLNKGQTERFCFYNGTLSGTEIQCSTVPTCRIVLPPKDPHVKFCKGHHCNRDGRDNLRDKTFDWPTDVIPQFGHVEFSCDSRYYCVDGNQSIMCLPHSREIRAPECKPVCGIRRYPKERLIKGGQATMIEAWPWQSALMEVRWKQVEFSCGATLIDDRWAITAAHCVTLENSTQIRDAKHWRLTYGDSSSSKSLKNSVDPDKEAQYKVSNIIVHSQYNARSLDNDIALLELETPAVIGYHVGVACLPTGDTLLEGGEQGMATGWGRTETHMLSEDLRELPLTVVNASECKQYYKDQGYNGMVVTDGMFCAISNSNIEDATDGDSGGPFVVQDNSGRWVLEGIISWGAPDSEEQVSGNRHAHVKLSKGAPLLPTCPGSACYGGYTRVANYIQWIHKQTGGRVGSKRCG